MATNPINPAAVAHYLAACAVARVPPATLSSRFTSAVQMRALMAQIENLSIPDAAELLRREMDRGDAAELARAATEIS